MNVRGKWTLSRKWTGCRKMECALIIFVGADRPFPTPEGVPLQKG
jgi:hypothetical protein